MKTINKTINTWRWQTDYILIDIFVMILCCLSSIWTWIVDLKWKFDNGGIAFSQSIWPIAWTVSIQSVNQSINTAGNAGLNHSTHAYLCWLIGARYGCNIVRFEDYLQQWWECSQHAHFMSLVMQITHRICTQPDNNGFGKIYIDWLIDQSINQSASILHQSILSISSRACTRKRVRINAACVCTHMRHDCTHLHVCVHIMHTNAEHW